MNLARFRGEACRAAPFVHPPARQGRPWTESTMPEREAGFRAQAARGSLGVPLFSGNTQKVLGQARCFGILFRSLAWRHRASSGG